jgi:hypothetical protein
MNKELEYITPYGLIAEKRCSKFKECKAYLGDY